MNNQDDLASQTTGQRVNGAISGFKVSQKQLCHSLEKDRSQLSYLSKIKLRPKAVNIKWVLEMNNTVL